MTEKGKVKDFTKAWVEREQAAQDQEVERKLRDEFLAEATRQAGSAEQLILLTVHEGKVIEVRAMMMDYRETLAALAEAQTLWVIQNRFTT